MKKKLLFLFVIILFCTKLTGQNNNTTSPTSGDSRIYRVELNDGMTFYAQIVKSDSMYYVFRTMSIPEVKVPKSTVVKITEMIADTQNQLTDTILSDSEIITQNVNATGKKRYSRDYLFASQYVLGNSAFPMKKNENFFQNTDIFVNSFNWGLSEHFSLCLTSELVSLINYQVPIVSVSPKLAFKLSDKVALGASASMLYNNYDDKKLLLFGNGILTIGTKDQNFSITAGSTNMTEHKLNFMGALSTALRTSNKFMFLSEIWIIPTGETTQYYNGYYNSYSYTETAVAYAYLFSAGMRYFNNNFAFDFGLVTNTEISKEILGVPYISFIFKL